MKIKVTTLYVDDQDKALRFYTDVLGFAKKTDFSQGPYRWLTLASPEEPNGTELQLALNNNPAAKAYQQAIFQQNQPAIMFADTIFTEDTAGVFRAARIRHALGGRTCKPLSGKLYWAAGGAAAGEASGVEESPFTRSFNSLLGLKKGIFLAGTSTRSPVFGLRPMRGLRWRVRKLPNPRISILSPARSERTMLSKMVSTTTSLSLRVSSASWDTSSIRSALVIRLFAP